jgi:hypothetical protein
MPAGVSRLPSGGRCHRSRHRVPAGDSCSRWPTGGQIRVPACAPRPRARIAWHGCASRLHRRCARPCRSTSAPGIPPSIAGGRSPTPNCRTPYERAWARRPERRSTRAEGDGSCMPQPLARAPCGCPRSGSDPSSRASAESSYLASATGRVLCSPEASKALECAAPTVSRRASRSWHGMYWRRAACALACVRASNRRANPDSSRAAPCNGHPRNGPPGSVPRRSCSGPRAGVSWQRPSVAEQMFAHAALALGRNKGTRTRSIP